MTTNGIPEINKILYPTDLSDNARHAFGHAAALANKFGAQITVFHVLERLPADAEARLTMALGDDRWRAIRDQNQMELLDAIHDRLKSFCESRQSSLAECPFLVEEIIVKEGHPVEQILEMTERKDYDVIVMGTHGRGFLGDALMGGTTRRVTRRANVPVMVVQLPDD